MDAQTWDTVNELVTWLDRSSTLPPETGWLLRVMKLAEEAGRPRRCHALLDDSRAGT
jgi:hypothetical protein